jgi:uncharacterized small protein (DUF1192 family)
MAKAPAKVPKSLRIDAELDTRVQALRCEGESDVAAYSRVITAGLDVLEGEEEEAAPNVGLVDALQANIADLREEASSLQAQLETKDGQIAALQTITANAQALHGATDALQAKQLEKDADTATEQTQAAPLAVARPRGRWARAWAALTGRDEERGASRG